VDIWFKGAVTNMDKSVRIKNLCNENIGNKYYLSETWLNGFLKKKINFKPGEYLLYIVDADGGCLFSNDLTKDTVKLYPRHNKYVNIYKI
jgi:hypothetical protein